jgi:hypothetical protein
VFVYQSANTQKQHNKTVITHFGSQWVILQRKFVHWLVEQLRDEHSWVSQFREHLIASKKLMTDETFLPTVLIHANDTDDDGAYDFSKTLPLTSSYNDMLLFRNGTESGITDVRYERMDEHYPSAFGVFPENQRYQVPEKLVKQNVLDQPRVWGPYFLGVYDLREIRETGAFFARKISALIDPNMVRLLPVDRRDQIPNIQWPDVVSLTDKPDWEVKKELWNEMTETERRDEEDDEEL